MGLDTTHGCWHGAYSAFSRWRDKLAEVAGYTFHPTRNELLGKECVDLHWVSIERTIGKDLMGKWPAVPVGHDRKPDALIVLLAHSDCEGEIQVEMLTPLADRLTELLPLLDALPPDGGHVGVWREKTQTFIDGLRLAAAANEPVKFH